MPLFWCQVKDNFMLCDMSGMNFFKFEVKEVIRRGSVKYGPVSTNGCALSLSFQINKKFIPLIRTTGNKKGVRCCYGWSDIFATK